MTDIYHSECCPGCGKKNFYCLGNPDDISGVDIEALICWKCGHKWLLEMCEEWTNLEDAYTEDGEKEIK